MTTIGFLFVKLVKQTQPDKILIEICECGRWTEFAKTSVCIILAALVYLESAKVYTGPKIVRALKRLRNTAIETQFQVKMFLTSTCVVFIFMIKRLFEILLTIYPCISHNVRILSKYCNKFFLYSQDLHSVNCKQCELWGCT